MKVDVYKKKNFSGGGVHVWKVDVGPSAGVRQEARGPGGRAQVWVV